VTLADTALTAGNWVGVVLVQVTLAALLGLAAWLAARRGGPALRAAILLSALLGVLVVPALATVAPVWFPLPECVCPALPPADVSHDAPAPAPPSPLAPTVVAFVVAPAPARIPTRLEVAPGQADDPGVQPVNAEAFILDEPSLPEEVVAPPAHPAEPPRPAWSLGGVLAAGWLLGALVWLGRALLQLAALYRCAWRARPIREADWIECAASLAGCQGLGAVVLRESPDILSPLTLGLFRPVILLPRGRRRWSAAQRALILSHELAHARRRDFLAGLVAEVASCLCWFHPLVRYLAGRLRLEQEYAADAWAAAADPTEYVRCLARLALERGRGRGALAPAFWRRRPEILRRIDMLRRNPERVALPLGRRAACLVAVLAALACLAVAGVGPLHSAPDGQPAAQGEPAKTAQASTDPQGDSLPTGALARLGTSRLRHGAEVTFVTFTPDGKTLVTAGRDNTIRLWNLASGKEIRRLARLRPVAAKPQLKEDRAAKEKAQAELMLRLMARGGGRGGTFCVALAPDGKTLAADCGSNAIQLWDVETGKELRQIQGPPGGLVGLLFSPDGRALAARSSNGTLVVWETDTGKEVRRIQPTPRPRNNGIVFVFGGGGDDGGDSPGMAFTPDGKQLVAAATDYEKQQDNEEQQAVGSVKFWDLATGKEVRKVPAPQGARASAVALTPDGKVLAYGSGGDVHLCAADTGKETRRIETKEGGIRTLVFSADGRTLAVRGGNQRVRMWDTATGKEVRQLREAEPAQQTGGLVLVSPDFSGPEVRALAFSPNGKRIVSASGSTVQLWEAATGKELPLPEGHRRAPTNIVLSPDGKVAVSWGADRVIRRWESATGRSLGSFPAPARTTRAALSPDGRTIALANADGTVRLHDTATGKEVNRLKGQRGAALAFAPDGKTLAVRGNDNAIRLYEAATGAEVRQIVLRREENPGRGTVIIFGGQGAVARGPGLAFSPDGKLLAAPAPARRNADNILVLLDVATGKELRKIDLPQAITSFAFSPDGRVLATENTDRTVTLWEVASGKERARLGKPLAEERQQGGGAMVLELDGQGFSFDNTPPAGPVGLAFSPDGRALVARGPDLVLRVWDVTAGKEVGRLSGHAGRVETVAFSRDGKVLASGATDTTILLWDATNPLAGLAKPRTAELPAARAEAIWNDLAGADAARSFRGVLDFASAPRQAVPFLSERLKPAARIDPKKIAGWIAELDSEKFAVRKEAAANLVKVGEQAVPALQKVLATSPPLETRKRVEELLDRLTGGTLTTEQLRVVRAVEALERMGTPEARRLLQVLAEGAPGALPTREAQAALARNHK
jgi:WD40 repeat protein/beta-lactamase regulating signal transducer with metallopeptidase domain